MFRCIKCGRYVDVTYTLKVKSNRVDMEWIVDWEGVCLNCVQEVTWGMLTEDWRLIMDVNLNQLLNM